MKENKVPTQSFIWNDGEFGRKASDVAAIFALALAKDRDYKEVIYYLDNCSGQNKNWTLFTSLVELVNSDQLAANTITFKFFEPGHTFMSADSIHAKLEKKICYQKLFDFEDLKSCYQMPNIEVTELKHTDIRIFKSHLSVSKRQNEGTLLSQ